MKAYEVNIISKQQSTFIVDADSKEDAENKAVARFENGETGDMPVIDYDRIENIFARSVE